MGTQNLLPLLRELKMNVGQLNPSELVRSCIGGVLMGLANLVPGISGGTMLLATGVYRKFVDAIAELSSLRISFKLILTLIAIGLPAACSILIFAGVFRDLVLAHRWIMYSIFIGLTLGGVPVILAQIKSFDKKLVLPVLSGICVMILTAFLQPGDSPSSDSIFMLFIGGALGASAMVLPGISGGYILLVMGQYVVILSGIDQFKLGLKTQDQAALLEAVKICLPVGIGVVTGIVAVSHIIRFFFRKYEDQTYGLLLGLLIGAVFGLWPFQSPVPPKIGDTIRGKLLTTQDMVDAVDGKYFPTAYFTPELMQIAVAILLIGAGFVLTVAIDRIGKKLEQSQSVPSN